MLGEERTGILGSLLAFLSLDREHQLGLFINLPNLFPKHILSNIRWQPSKNKSLDSLGVCRLVVCLSRNGF